MKLISTIIKKYWILLIIAFIIPIILGQILRIPFGHLTIAGEGDWVGFFGNYSGGIIGGIVAFIVATHEIKNQREQEIIRNLSKELPVLTGIEIECNKIIGQLKNIDKCLDEIKEKEKFTVLFDGLIWDRWNNINVINDPVLQEELIKHFEALHRNIDTFEVDVEELENNLEKKKALERKMNPIDSGYTRLIRQIEKENTFLKLIKNDKIHYFSELRYCIEKTEKINSIVRKRKSKIHDILSESNYYSDDLLTRPEEYKVNRQL